MTVPLHFANEDTSPGVKLGGVVSHIVNEVDISAKRRTCPSSSKWTWVPWKWTPRSPVRHHHAGRC